MSSKRNFLNAKIKFKLYRRRKPKRSSSKEPRPHNFWPPLLNCVRSLTRRWISCSLSRSAAATKRWSNKRNKNGSDSWKNNLNWERCMLRLPAHSRLRSSWQKRRRIVWMNSRLVFQTPPRSTMIRRQRTLSPRMRGKGWGKKMKGWNRKGQRKAKFPHPLKFTINTSRLRSSIG